jgi:dihydroorotate dehydrogenase (fumarate)
VKIPVSVKLGPVYTNPLNVVTRLDAAGASAFVLFNRLWHPEIDIDAETTSFPFRLSSSGEHGLALRYVGLFAGEVNAPLCAASGIHEGSEAIQLLLAGADTFQVVSALYHYGLQIEKILGDIEIWMDRKGCESIDQFRGKLSAANSEESWTYRRAQYVRHLVNNKDYITRSMALQIGRDEDAGSDSSV